MSYWEGKRVTVTGGAGFLGGFLVEKLRKSGAELFIPRSQSYDLTVGEGTRRMYQDAKPDILMHLAARVGGIGANQQNPGLFFMRTWLWA